jgi:PleD family two-component response regulator
MTNYSPPPRTRILLAVTPDMRERLARILARHELTTVDTSDAAMSALEDRHGIVILGVHFDDSQMFSLLGDIRAHSGYRKVPILCVLGSRGRAITDIAVEGLDHAVKAMRANGFLDLSHFPDEEESNARICRIVDYLILIDGDLQHIARTTGETLIPADRRRSAN